MAALVSSCAKLSGATAIFLATAIAAVAQSQVAPSQDGQPREGPPQDGESRRERAQPAPDIPAIVRELGADDYRLRNAAELRLAEIGRPAREALVVAAEGSDAETRLRAREL